MWIWNLKKPFTKWNLSSLTYRLEGPDRSILTIGPKIMKRKAMAQKNKKTERMGLAHIAEQKWREKIKIGWIVGLGPCRRQIWTGLISIHDHLVWSPICHVGFVMLDLTWTCQIACHQNLGHKVYDQLIWSLTSMTNIKKVAVSRQWPSTIDQLFLVTTWS